ncbi:MAG: DUF1232 domain-containing protein [Salinarimonadaceae bacterium]|nr:MAG: DUF1232 domain-containing protein [Salinarimonadaceae bacterium]
MGQAGFDEELHRIFTPEEMEAIRRAARDEEDVLRGARRKLLRLAGHLPFAEDAMAGWYCVRDENTPRRVKLILFAALAYFVMPFDVIPDFLPIVGFTDDAAVIAAALAAVAGAITSEHRDLAREALRAVKG